jgi:hypothetical protein
MMVEPLIRVLIVDDDEDDPFDSERSPTFTRHG